VTNRQTNAAEGSAKWILLVIFGIILVVLLFNSTYIVPPGMRGVKVTLGKVDPMHLPEGFGWKAPFLTSVSEISVRQTTQEMDAECYSSDLQQINILVRVLYSIPESQVVSVFRDYAGDPFDNLIAPRVHEALKEFTALQSAEMIVKQREAVKGKALVAAREKVGALIRIEDIVLENISLTRELEQAIEQKMVQEQEASKARFIQERSKIEAETVIIKARAEAESIKIRGDALKDNPDLIALQIVEKWDGRAPLVIGGTAGGNAGNVILPIPINAQPQPPARP
jgi:prohibitin 2